MNLANATNRKVASLALLDWLNTEFPGIKRKVLAQVGVPNNLQGLGSDRLAALGQDDFFGPPASLAQPQAQASDVAWYDKIISAAEAIIPAYAQYETQKQIVDLQMERAKAGQPPLDVTQYRAPPISVQHGFAPGSLTQGIDPQTKNALMIGGGILAAIFAVNMMGKG